VKRGVFRRLFAGLFLGVARKKKSLGRIFQNSKYQPTELFTPFIQYNCFGIVLLMDRTGEVWMGAEG